MLHWPLHEETKSEKKICQKKKILWLYYAAELQIFLLGADIFYTMGSITQHTDPGRRRHAREIQGQRSFVLWESWRERTSNLFFGEEKGKNEMWPSTLKYWIKRWTVAAARNPIDTWNVNLSTRLSQWLKKEKALLCERKVPTSAIFVTYIHICLYPSL